MKDLVKKFIETYEAPEDLNFLLRHYLKDNDKDWLLERKSLIQDFIFDNLLSDIENINKENIEKISNFEDYLDFIDWTINIYNEDLNKNIELFWDFIETFWDKEEFYKNLMDWQRKAYEKILIDIKEKFVKFLKEQLK